jgi:hypothetical protein
MPLEKQIVDLKINAGMDELSDPYLSTRPVAMQNVRYQRTGALTKRRGSTTIGLTNANQLKRSNYVYAAVGEPEAIYSHRGTLTMVRGHALDLVQPVGAATNLYKIDFVPRQIGNPTVVTKDLNYGFFLLNGATTLKVVVAGITYYGLAYVRRSSTTSELIFALFSEGLANLFVGTVDSGTLPTGPLNPRLAWNGAAGIVITYGKGSSNNFFVTFNIQTLTLNAPAIIPSIVGRFLTEDYAIQYDDAVNMTRIFYFSISPGQMTLDTVDPITLVRNNSVVVAALANFASATGVHVGMQIQQYIGLTWGDSQASAGTVFGALRTRAVTPLQQFAPQPIWNAPGDLILQVGTYYDRIHPTINTFEDAQLFCALVKKPSGQILHVWRMYDQTGIAQYPTQEIGSNGWIAQPGPSSVPILPEMDASPAVYFKAMRSYDGDPYYKIDGVVGLNIIKSSTPDAIGAYSQGYNGVFAFGGYSEDIGIVRPRNSLPPTLDAYTGLMSGGMTSVFDGANIVESAPFGAPLYSKFAAAQGTGGVLQLLMTYGYAFIYSYTDAIGRKYRSAITYSPPIALVGANNAFVLTVPAAYMGNARSKKVVVEIYRTVGNGATFYLLNQVDAVPSGTTVYSDNSANPITDTILATREVLYNTDGSDQAITGPACDSLAYSNGRIWSVGTGDDRVYFTSDVTDGDAPRFTATFSFPVLSNTPIVAAAQLDTSTILMSSNELFRISGDGPALAPSGGGVFSPPQPIASEDGCFSPRSVITLDEGVAYQNKAGLKLLSRGGQVVDYGADIGPALGTDTITHLIGKALWPVIVPELEEVRWLAQTNSAITHVVTDRYLSRTSQRPVWYSYLFSQPTGASEVVAQCMHNNFPTWVTANGYVYRDDPTSFLDNAESLTSLWVTADITFEQWRPQSVNGFMRIWKVALLAERKTPHDLTLRQFYNFSTSAGSTVTWTSSEVIALDRESLQVRCKYQRLNGIQVRITDATPSTGGTIGTGEGLSIKGLSLELGIDKGVVRRPAASQK